MAEQTIGDRQEELQRWYQEWLSIDTGSWQKKTPESLLSYFKDAPVRHAWTVAGG